MLPAEDGSHIVSMDTRFARRRVYQSKAIHSIVNPRCLIHTSLPVSFEKNCQHGRAADIHKRYSKKKKKMRKK